MFFMFPSHTFVQILGGTQTTRGKIFVKASVNACMLALQNASVIVIAVIITRVAILSFSHERWSALQSRSIMFCPLCLSSETDRGDSCLAECLPVLCSLLLPPPSVITSSTAHRLTIRWGPGHKLSSTSSRLCGILNSPHTRAAGQQEAFCTSEVPQPAGQSAGWD